MKLKGKNFLSWADLSFTVRKGVTMIRGYNHDDGTEEGSGKSAIVNLMSWCLYGQIPKEANVDDVVKEGTPGTETEVELEEFTVFRSRKPNDLHIKYTNGKIFRGKDARETQKKIIELVGMTFETFCQSIYFAQNYPNKFVTANQENKGKILSEILDLEQFDRARKTAADRMKPIAEDLVREQTKLNGYEGQINLQKKTVENFHTLIEEFGIEKIEKIQKLFKEHDALSSEARGFEVEFNSKKADSIKTLNTLLAGVKKSRKSMIEEMNALEEQIKTLDTEEFESDRKLVEEKLEALSEVRENARGRLLNIDADEKAYLRMKREIEEEEHQLKISESDLLHSKKASKHAENVAEIIRKELTQAIEAQENPSKENCPTCKQPWNGDPAHYAREVQKANKNLDNANASFVSSQNHVKEAMRRVDSHHSKLETLRTEFEVEGGKGKPDPKHFEQIIEQNSADRDVLKNTLKEINAAESQVKETKNQHNLLSVKLANLNRQEKELTEKRDEVTESSPALTLEKFAKKQAAIEDEIESEDAKQPESLMKKREAASEDLKKMVNGSKETEAKAEELKESLNRLAALREGYREVKAYTFENTLRQLTSKTNLYLRQLFNQQVKIKFRNEDLKIETMVKIDGQERPLGLYSGGQFRRIALAVDLALADITLSRKGNKLNLMIMDEYFKDLSTTSMTRILKILQERRTPTLLIEHNDLFKAIVDQNFNVELRGGTSRAI